MFSDIFTFNNEVYIQTHGTSIGPKMAPSYACLGMGSFEMEMKEKISIQPLVWKRYIDDIWGLWDKG